MESISRKLNYDAAIVLALHLSKEPLTVEELIGDLKEIIGKEQIYQNSIRYRNLRRLVENKAVRKLNIHGTERYVLRGYVDEHAKVAFAIFDFTRVNGRWPSVEEIGLDSEMAPAKAEEIAFELSQITGWRPPKGRLDEAPDFIDILELAAWVKMGCERAEYITSRWKISDVERAKKIIKRYPDLVPTVEAESVGENEEQFDYRMVWRTDVPFNAVIRSAITTRAEKKRFSGCLQYLRIRNKPNSESDGQTS